MEGKAGIRRAWLRRELRGLVLWTTGEVVVRGLHKFFSIGQLGEVRLCSLQGKRICEVTDKLDGQMIMGPGSGGYSGEDVVTEGDNSRHSGWEDSWECC